MKSTPVSRGGSGGGNGNVDDESLQLIRGGDVPLAPSLSSPPLGRKRIAGSSQQQSSKRSLRGKEILDPYLGIAERESAEIMSMSMPPKPWCFDLPDKERCTRLDGCIYNYREYMCCCDGAGGYIGSGPFDSGSALIVSSVRSSSESGGNGGGSFFFRDLFIICIVVVGVCALYACMTKLSSGRSGGRRRGGSGHVVSGPPHAHVDSGGGNWGWGGGGGGDGGGGGGGGCGSGGGGGGGGKQRYYAAFLFDPSILCLISCYDMLIVFVFLHPDRSNNRRLWRWRIKQEN